ncbi:transposase [Longimicrobium terrae]|uniref:transposase n=1 Tax=Longimicrobium terrae TaxID=1639882 RepID=UPI0014736329|nr:transposase [Longimicrobium terrae]NNC28292.1 transposase [Longimicrobium terrae]NNC30633.1 transposase [Longimicrobium terrae]NNC30687.1 transposase [Longimicrobium terrae]NNC32376.1 transposase [Longimicrobium terrae]NNC32666.1 transposase [Longimicrobium terrae]
MLSIEDLLLQLYCLVDEFCRANPALLRQHAGSRGPAVKLSPSEIVTLSIFSQWDRFGGERGFFRFAEPHLRPLFPNLCDRTQFNRASRRFHPVTAAFFLHLAERLGSREAPYEIIDQFGVATRRSGRRGSGWLGGYTDKGKCSRLGYFHGVQVLSATTSSGAITGFGIGPGSTKDQPMAGTFFRLRRNPPQGMPWLGRPAAGQIYIADKGFSGPNRHREWFAETGALLTCAPQEGHAPAWPRELRRALARMRQMCETVHEKLLNRFRLERERPHSMDGLFTRLCAKASLHNACILINRQLGRQPLAFADLLGW